MGAGAILPLFGGERGLQVGDIIAYDGGLVEYENGQAYIHKSNILYQDGAYYTPQPMPDPPKPEPAKPTPPNPVSTPQPNTGKTPTPSTSSPGYGGGSGSSSGGKPVYGQPLPTYGPPVPTEHPAKTDEEIWKDDTTLRPLLDDLGYKLSIGESQSLYETPSWVETWLGYEIKLTASASAAIGSGSVTVSTDTNLKDIKSIGMKFGDFSTVFDKKYASLQATHAINDEWAISVGYKWSWFTSYCYLAVAYSPKESAFAVSCALYVKKQDWKHLLFKAVIALAIVFGPEILAVLGQAGASAAVVSLSGLVINTVAAA